MLRSRPSARQAAHAPGIAVAGSREDRHLDPRFGQPAGIGMGHLGEAHDVREKERPVQPHRELEELPLRATVLELPDDERHVVRLHHGFFRT